MFFYFPFSLLLSLLPATEQGTSTPPAEPAKIEWRAGRPLTWADFKSRPATDQLAALTSSTIDAKVGCTDFVFSADVRAVFVPHESWVRDPQRATPALLRHEQAHFDLTEIHTRMLRQKLTLVKFDCLKLQPAFNNLTKVAFLAWQREEARYDGETNHGLNKEKQQAWEQRIQERLQQLEAYAVK
ncbi:hypothetical protein GCM10027346_30160 [Hymenobacter seoulensis]